MHCVGIWCSAVKIVRFVVRAEEDTLFPSADDRVTMTYTHTCLCCVFILCTIHEGIRVHIRLKTLLLRYYNEITRKTSRLNSHVSYSITYKHKWCVYRLVWRVLLCFSDDHLFVVFIQRRIIHMCSIHTVLSTLNIKRHDRPPL